MSSKLRSLILPLSLCLAPYLAHSQAVLSCAGKNIKPGIGFFNASEKTSAKAQKITFHTRTFFVTKPAFLTTKDIVKVELPANGNPAAPAPLVLTLSKNGTKKIQTATRALAKSSGWLAIMDGDTVVSIMPVQSEIGTEFLQLGRVGLDAMCSAVQ